MDDTSRIARSLRDNPNGFIVLLLEKVPEGTVFQEYRERESSWMSRLDTLHSGYNKRRQIAKPADPLVPPYGFGPAPIKRSRHSDRIKIPNFLARYLTREGIKRTVYLKSLVQNRPDEVDKYVSSLRCRTIQRILKYLSSIRREDVFKEISVILRQRYLSKFPVPKVPMTSPPRLHIIGYTSTLADIIPLRALYSDPSLLALLPRGDFRDAIRTTIPAFFYGETVDRMMINTTNNAGKNPDQQSTCNATQATVCKVDEDWT